jgi:N-acetylmuramoyl-L-alanine amidase
MNYRVFIMLPIILIVVGLVIGGNDNHVNAFSDQIIQKGATGDDVIELQSRLQYNGYYHGTIDGVFGWSTYWSVRNFQKAFGLEDVDGLVGQKSKEMLQKFTKYNKEFVYSNLKEGNRFTHYGGVAWDIQKAPSQQTIEKAKQSAEARKVEFEKQYQTQGNKVEQPKKQQDQGKAQQQQPQKKQQQPQKPIEQGQAKQQPQEQQQDSQKQQQQGQAQQQQPAKEKQNQAQKQEPKKQDQAKVSENKEEPGPTAVNMPGGYSQNDIQLMSNAVYGEARGESYIGQVAIAAVILNRLNSPTFPNTISGVIFEPLAFTAVADGQIWLTPNEQAKKAVLDAINGTDPTDGATYYFNPDTATSKWIWGRPQIKRIGKHIFCR